MTATTLSTLQKLTEAPAVILEAIGNPTVSWTKLDPHAVDSRLAGNIEVEKRFGGGLESARATIWPNGQIDIQRISEFCKEPDSYSGSETLYKELLDSKIGKLPNLKPHSRSPAVPVTVNDEKVWKGFEAHMPRAVRTFLSRFAGAKK